MQLATKRFILRDFEDDDLSPFVEYHTDPRSSELYAPGENTPDHAVKLVHLFKAWAAEKPRQNYQLAIIRHDGQLIGCGGIRKKDAGPGRAELGIELAPSNWGRYGYAIEVMKCLVNFGFNQCCLEQIFGNTVSGNARIARLANAFGATAIERSTPKWMETRGWQQIEWQIRREQWLSRTSHKRL